MRSAHRFDVILAMIFAALLLVATTAFAAIMIVGIDCKKLVLIGGDTIVCVQPPEIAIPGLLKIADSDQFIREAYETLLLRRVDAPGYLYWSEALSEGRASREGMLRAIVASTEFRSLVRY